MKRFGIMAAGVLLSFILQTSLLGFFDIFGIIPNISLILVVVFALMSDGVTGGIIGLMTGILYDGMLYDVFGVYTLSFFVIGAVIGSYSDNMMRENYLAYCAAAGVSTVAMHLMVYVLLFFLKYSVESAVFAFRSVAVETVLNTLLTVLVLKFVLFIFGRLNLK